MDGESTMNDIKAELPDKMTGKDLIVQEAYEESIDKNLFNSMDRVDRRDRRLHIVSSASSGNWRKNYSKIDWTRG
jgi:hypothetical protein